MKKILFILIVIFSISANAAEKQSACAKYKKEYGWSKGYSVEAIVISGSDLNEAVGSFTRFRAFSTYAVIFWDKDQAVILKLPPFSMGTLPMFETEVEDQNGRKWKIREGNLFCY